MEIFEMLQQTFRETALSQSKTFEWYSQFKNGHTSINGDPYTGKPSTAGTKTVDHVSELICKNRCLMMTETADEINITDDHVNELICKNRCLMMRETADELNISFGTCQVILMHDLGIRHVSAKLVPGLLTQD
jgi:hypothetical protein